MQTSTTRSPQRGIKPAETLADRELPITTSGSMGSGLSPAAPQPRALWIPTLPRALGQAPKRWLRLLPVDKLLQVHLSDASRRLRCSYGDLGKGAWGRKQETLM